MASIRMTVALLIAANGCGSDSREQAPIPKTAPAATTPAPPRERTDQEREGVAKLVGTTPPEWQTERWLNSPPKTLASLRGSVVLVRWWTAECPYCSTSAPALRAFHQKFGPRGLQVIGMYHHKGDGPFEPSVYEETARKYGFVFPVAFDPGWKTLGSWMRDRAGNEVSTGWTSVTFVLDKQGVVRHVHPGGEYSAGEPGYQELERAIEQLL